METPNNNAGLLTEKIMYALVRGEDPAIPTKVDTWLYNRIYARVYRTLEGDARVRTPNR